MNELVEKLSQGKHPIEAARCQSAAQLKQQIERNFVLIKFSQTDGATELGCQLDTEKSQLSDGDFDNSTGVIHLVGHLMLDYVKVELVADVSLENLAGTGCLIVADSAATQH